jgi:hypothetical protein
MNSKSRGDDVFQGMGWVAGSTSALLLISDGLALLAQQAHDQVSVTILLLALYLAPWLYVLGLVGLLFLSVWWLVGWLRVLVKPGAVSRYSSAEPRSPHLERPEREGLQFLQQGVTPVVPSRSSMDSDDRKELPGQSEWPDMHKRRVVALILIS